MEEFSGTSEVVLMYPLGTTQAVLKESRQVQCQPYGGQRGREEEGEQIMPSPVGGYHQCDK